MGFAAELLGGGGSGKDAHDPTQSGVGPGLQVERSITDRNYLRDVADKRRFHRVKEHKRRRPPLRDIVAANGSCEVSLPAETAKDRPGDCAIETRCGGDEISALAQIFDGLFGPGNRRDRLIDRDEVRGELGMDLGRKLVAIYAWRKLGIHEITDDLAFGSSAAPADLLGG